MNFSFGSKNGLNFDFLLNFLDFLDAKKFTNNFKKLMTKKSKKRKLNIRRKK